MSDKEEVPHKQNDEVEKVEVVESEEKEVISEGNCMEIDGEVVQLRDKKEEREDKGKKRRSLRSSIRESFRNNVWKRSSVRRVKSYEPQKGQLVKE
jgi:hypothetical protein